MARARYVSLVSALALLCVTPTGADAREVYSVAVPADWVDVYSLEAADLEIKAAASDGALYVLSDAQQHWDGRDSAIYYRVVTKIAQPDALSDASSIQLSFDPGYQELTIHAVTVRRGGQTLDRLASARIDVLQREESLERRLLNGEKTVSIEMRDVRVGDIVDYSFTRSGRNPVWRGHHFETFTLEYGVAVGIVRVRLTVPTDRYLNVGYINERVEPLVTTQGRESTYEWMVRNGEGVASEDDAPDWHIGERSIEVSSFRSWQEVIESETPLYAVPETLSPSLQAAIDEIRREHPDPRSRLREILALAQRDIRYLGIELGEGGYVPRNPSLVLEQRFGDCKDKSLLMVTMARAMEITAFPAIVDTSKRISVNGIAPTPGYFDHVIVFARIGDESFWLDPTRVLQSGTLDQVYQPDFGAAMVLEPGAADLTEMKAKRSETATVKIDEIFDLSRSFDGSPADFRVTTRYYSYRADSIREDVRSNGIEELQKQFFNYYKRMMPSLALTESMNIVDDIDANRVTIHERYSIGSPWRWDGEDDQFEFIASPYEVEALLDKPSVVTREAPYRRTHPVDVVQKTSVILPFAQEIEEEEIGVEHPAFRFTKKIRYDANANTVALEYRYVSKADAVAADQIESYLTRVQEADNLGWYWVSTRHLSERGKADLFDYEELIGLVALGYILLLPPAWFLYRKFRPAIDRPGAHYFPVDRTKFLWMSVLTCGCYSTYWVYRCWLSIQRRGVGKIMPRLSGLFYPITYFWLLRDVNRTAVEQGEMPVGRGWLWAAGLGVWMVASMAGNAAFTRQLPVAATLFVPILVSLIGAAILLPCVILVARLDREALGANEPRFGVDSWLAILIFLPIALLGIDTERPTDDVTDVAESAVEYLVELELLEHGETVEVFRAPRDFHFRQAGSVITDRKVFRYWTSEDQSDWYSEKAAYDDIVSISFDGSSDEGTTEIRFVRQQGDTVDLVLPKSEGRVAEAIARLVERSPSASVSFTGMDAVAIPAARSLAD